MHPLLPHLQALDVIAGVKTEPLGSIRRINVEIPPLSVSDMRRLKATDKVGTFVLFQETYHRPTFKTMHPTGPKSDYDYRVLTQVGEVGEMGGAGDRGRGKRIISCCSHCPALLEPTRGAAGTSFCFVRSLRPLKARFLLLLWSAQGLLGGREGKGGKEDSGVAGCDAGGPAKGVWAAQLWA